MTARASSASATSTIATRLSIDPVWAHFHLGHATAPFAATVKTWIASGHALEMAGVHVAAALKTAGAAAERL